MLVAVVKLTVVTMHGSSDSGDMCQ
jgi:hypothetical protein